MSDDRAERFDEKKPLIGRLRAAAYSGAPNEVIFGLLTGAATRIEELEAALRNEYMRGYHVGVKDGFNQ